MMGKRPTNSGMSPYWMRSVCSTCRSTALEMADCAPPFALRMHTSDEQNSSNSNNSVYSNIIIVKSTNSHHNDSSNTDNKIK